MTKRFKEIISTQKVIDTVTNKEYDCLLDNDLFDLINVIAEENEQSKKHREELFYRERDAKNDWRKLKYENEQLKKENNKIKNILLNKKKDLECDYNRGAKAGMPTGGIIGELITIEDILEEMEWKND